MIAGAGARARLPRFAPILWAAAGKKRMGGPSLQRFLYALPRAVGGGGASALEVRDRCRERALERLGAGNLRGAVSAALESLAAIETANADALELGAGETLPGALPWCRVGRRRLSLFSSRSSLSLSPLRRAARVCFCAVLLYCRCVACGAPLMAMKKARRTTLVAVVALAPVALVAPIDSPQRPLTRPFP